MEAYMKTVASTCGRLQGESARMSVPNVPTKDTAPGDRLPEKRAFGILAELRFQRLLADVMKRSGKNRSQIADEMSRILGRPVGKNVLDDCVRSRKKGRMVRFPAAWIPAICEATQNDELQRHLLSERLLDFLAIGERVNGAARSLKQAQEAVAKIAERKSR
jgi:hypothetical protein